MRFDGLPQSKSYGLGSIIQDALRLKALSTLVANSNSKSASSHKTESVSE